MIMYCVCDQFLMKIKRTITEYKDSYMVVGYIMELRMC